MSARFHTLSAVLQRVGLLSAVSAREAAQLHEAIDQILIARGDVLDIPRAIIPQGEAPRPVILDRSDGPKIEEWPNE
ncbi:hypothetical protein QM467_04870 [Rhodoblastus sp. 17X3]|uniref:hypothetical protein n=1 Tax=Rhodoblastus sp. 17X3 TaxID=3047026 RepID=UPI0024B673A1|nr:hypothetical protein [Rhodoblastus sp. 17X3]MDI9847393.1 hypothetical protein [Rhodoblastus sp. 17X3]